MDCRVKPGNDSKWCINFIGTCSSASLPAPHGCRGLPRVLQRAHENLPRQVSAAEDGGRRNLVTSGVTRPSARKPPSAGGGDIRGPDRIGGFAPPGNALSSRDHRVLAPVGERHSTTRRERLLRRLRPPKSGTRSPTPTETPVLGGGRTTPLRS